MLGETLNGIIWYFLSTFLLYRIFKCIMVVWRTLKVCYLAKKLGWTIDVHRYKEKWAVVTGCTDGIGKAYALELAKRGIRKFLLLGRNPAKLEDVSSLLSSAGATDVEQHVFDFATDDWEKLPREQLSTYDIGILVNCAGLALHDVAPWADHPPGLAAHIVRVNSVAPVQMMDIVLRRMLAADDGIIVNVASIQGWRPMSHLLTYPGSKACLTFISEALNDEYKSTNVKIQCLIPVLVATKMTFLDKSEADGYLIVDTEDYARQAVDMIGIERITTGCLQHEIQTIFLTFIPFWLLRILMRPFYSYQGRRVRAAQEKAKTK